MHLIRTTLRFAPAAALLALVLTASPVSADDAKPRKPSKATLEKYDADKDGVLNEEEAAKAKADAAAKAKETRRKNLEKYDADGDGKLSDAEKAKRKADEAAEREAKKKQP